MDNWWEDEILRTKILERAVLLDLFSLEGVEDVPFKKALKLLSERYKIPQDYVENIWVRSADIYEETKFDIENILPFPQRKILYKDNEEVDADD